MSLYEKCCKCGLVLDGSPGRGAGGRDRKANKSWCDHCAGNTAHGGRYDVLSVADVQKMNGKNARTTRKEMNSTGNSFRAGRKLYIYRGDWQDAERDRLEQSVPQRRAMKVVIG